LDSKTKKAVNMFKNGFLCSQAVLSAFSPEMGLNKEQALRMGVGFGSGVAERQNICGAVSAAVMIIGLKYGSDKPNDIKRRQITYNTVNKFCKLFTKKNGSINCAELLGCDHKEASNKNLYSSLCTNYVKDTSEILNKILKDK